MPKGAQGLWERKGAANAAAEGPHGLYWVTEKAASSGRGGGRGDGRRSVAGRVTSTRSREGW